MMVRSESSLMTHSFWAGGPPVSPCFYAWIPGLSELEQELKLEPVHVDLLTHAPFSDDPFNNLWLQPIF